MQAREGDSRINGFGHYVNENAIPRQDRFQETMETFTSELNIRFSQQMDSMLSMMHDQINRAISTAKAERVVPEIQNIVSSMSSCESDSSPKSRENTRRNYGFKSHITKKDSQSLVALELQGTVVLTLIKHNGNLEHSLY